MHTVTRPPYASAIIFELWANPRTKQRETATVRLRFQNSTELLDPTAAIPLVPLPIPGCSSPFDCSLTEFESLYASLVPTNWDEECALYGTVFFGGDLEDGDGVLRPMMVDEAPHHCHLGLYASPFLPPSLANVHCPL